MYTDRRQCGALITYNMTKCVHVDKVRSDFLFFCKKKNKKRCWTSIECWNLMKQSPFFKEFVENWALVSPIFGKKRSIHWQLWFWYIDQSLLSVKVGEMSIMEHGLCFEVGRNCLIILEISSVGVWRCFVWLLLRSDKIDAFRRSF